MRHIGGGGGFRRIGGGGFSRIDPGFGRHPHFTSTTSSIVTTITGAGASATGGTTGPPPWSPPRYAAAPVWNRCTCLTKEYTPEGAVVFKDLCTKEIAMNPPAVQSSAYDASQDPAAQVSLQPQLQAQPVMPQVR